LTISVDPVNRDVDRYRIRFKWRGATPLAAATARRRRRRHVRLLRRRARAPHGRAGRAARPWKGRPDSFTTVISSRASDGIARFQLNGMKAGVDRERREPRESDARRRSTRGGAVWREPTCSCRFTAERAMPAGDRLGLSRRTFKAIGAGTFSVARMRGRGTVGDYG
jgi:hypothetical protein